MRASREMNSPTLGTKPEKGQYRDAVHVAVVPVIAGERLAPGLHVGFMKDGRMGVVVEPVGIVDPFLKDPVEEGDIFWLCLYMGSITSLRHVWSHKAFKAALPGGGHDNE